MRKSHCWFDWMQMQKQMLSSLILVEHPDLIAFTGDNIFGSSATDAAESLFKAILPAIESGTPWAAILGNHDQESTMTREELMGLAELMDYSVSRVNPKGQLGIDGFGNYDVRVNGAFGSELANTSVFNLYFLDSVDRAVVGGVRTYGWIKESQQAWLRSTSKELQMMATAREENAYLAEQPSAIFGRGVPYMAVSFG